MRYVLGFICVLALGLMGCSETSGTGGAGGVGGDGGSGGATGQEFPCTEQGVLDAIAEGGGPHTFACDGPTTVVTEATIDIDNDVILDGEGNLTVDGGLDHIVFEVENDVTTELHGFTVTRGSNPADAGGIVNGGTLTLTNSTVSGNRGGRNFSGSGIVSVRSLTLTNSTVSGNDGSGAAIFSVGTLTVTNSTVSGNDDVGISLTNVTATLTNSTVSGNSGAGIDNSSGTLAMANSVVDGECLGSVTTSNGYNIESPGDTCGFDQETDQVEVTAEQLNLGPLADHGGPTRTHALGQGSVAVDAIPEAQCTDAPGEPLTNDQRGVTRPQGAACDVGAFEQEVGEGCVASELECTSAQLDPIEEMCEVIVPDQPNACDGTESVENPASCTASGNTITHQLTKMQIATDCNAGYDLDGCVGRSCISTFDLPDGTNGVDNGLGSSAVLWSDVGLDLGAVDQAFHDAICTGAIDIGIEVDAVPQEGCAVVTVSAAGVEGDPMPMNLNDAGCLSGALGTIPVRIGDVDGSIENAVVRTTVSSLGFSHGILGGTADERTAGAMADLMLEGASAVVPQLFDINADLSVDSAFRCNALSLTLEIAGSAQPAQ